MCFVINHLWVSTQFIEHIINNSPQLSIKHLEKIFSSQVIKQEKKDVCAKA